jgi:hypothetical protein
MLNPISKSGLLSIEADSRLGGVSLSPYQTIEAARRLHELLFDGIMLVEQKQKLAREISGRLFAVEAHRILPDPCRAYFLRLRNDAHDRANNHDSKILPLFSRVSGGYDQIEEAVRYSA